MRVLAPHRGLFPAPHCGLPMRWPQENASREFAHEKISALIKARQERGWLVTFLGEGLDVAKLGTSLGTYPSSVAAYAGGDGLRAAGVVLASSSSRYAKSVGNIRRAQASGALTPEERAPRVGEGGNSAAGFVPHGSIP